MKKNLSAMLLYRQFVLSYQFSPASLLSAVADRSAIQQGSHDRDHVAMACTGVHAKIDVLKVVTVVKNVDFKNVTNWANYTRFEMCKFSIKSSKIAQITGQISS